MTISKFHFEKEIEHLAKSIDNIISKEKNEAIKKGVDKFAHVLSIQVVIFESEEMGFTIYNYCVDEENYFNEVETFFKQQDPLSEKAGKTIKSPLQSQKDHKLYGEDDGIWYNERPHPIEMTNKLYALNYHEREGVKAQPEAHGGYKNSKIYWEEWCKFIYTTVYKEDANSVFLKRNFIELPHLDNINSGIFLTFNCYLNNRNIVRVTNLCEELLHNISYKVLIPNLYDRVNQQATKAAISQVMARNMSHNIGSHVLSRMVSKTEINEFINDTPSYSPQGGQKHQYTPLGIKAYNDLRAVDLLANFTSYLKSRMDYLADVTMSVPALETTKYFFKEVLGELDKNRLLLDRISGISDFKYRIIVRNLTNKDDKCCSAEVCQEKCCDCIIKENSPNDILVSMPNDILGAHAFFVIFENFIRNSAKHGHVKNELILYIDIKNNPEIYELFEINIYDNSVIEKSMDPVNDDDINLFNEAKLDYKIYDKLDKIVLRQNALLNQSVLKNGSLRMGGWGLIEMDASAAYLRKIPVEKIDMDDYDLEINPESEHKFKNEKGVLNTFKAIKVDNKHLGYRMFLMKPKEVLIIDEEEDYEITLKRKLQEKGILICGKKNGDADFWFDHTKVYPHKLVLVTNIGVVNKNITASEPALGRCSGLTKRIVTTTSEIIKNLISQYADNTKELILQCWWLYKQEIDDKFLNCDEITDIKIEELIYGGKIRQKLAYYSTHGYDFKETWHSKEHDYQFVEIDTSLTKIFRPSFGHLSPELICFLQSQFINVVVIDERIQQYLVTAKYKPEHSDEIDIRDIFFKTGILVPSPTDDCNLNEQNFGKEYKKILNFILSHKQVDFIVLHLGILEKMIDVSNDLYGKHYEKTKKGIELFIENEFISQGVDPDSLIVISGRGQPHNLPEGLRYLNYSIVSQYLIEVRYKYLFTEALFSARKLR